jgi:hypothetical protein
VYRSLATVVILRLRDWLWLGKFVTLVLRILVLALLCKEFVLFEAYFTKELSQWLALTPVGQLQLSLSHQGLLHVIGAVLEYCAPTNALIVYHILV